MGKKTPTGKFRGKVTIGVDQNGNPIHKYVSAPTRRELENVKAAVREHFIFGREIPRDMQFCEYAEQWYTLRKEPFIFQASRSSYKTCFMKHILPEFGLQKMKAISSAQIQEFINSFDGTSKSQITMMVACGCIEWRAVAKRHGFPHAENQPAPSRASTAVTAA